MRVRLDARLTRHVEVYGPYVMFMFHCSVVVQARAHAGGVIGFDTWSRQEFLYYAL